MCCRRLIRYFNYADEALDWRVLLLRCLCEMFSSLFDTGAAHLLPARCPEVLKAVTRLENLLFILDRCYKPIGSFIGFTISSFFFC